MKTEDFERYLRNGESSTVEFKRCGNTPGGDTFETVCSFANRSGGNLFLGVTDDGAVSGLGTPDSDEIKRNIINVLNNPKLFNGLPAIEFEDIPYAGKAVLRVWIPVDSVVHRYKGEVYDRIFDEDVRVTGEAQIAALYLRKQNIYTEQRIFPYLAIDDLDHALIEKARLLATAQRAGHPWATMSDEELVRSARLWGNDYQMGAKGLNLACALIFGGDDVIASVAPAYVTDAVCRRTDQDRYDDRIDVRTNLIDSYELLVDFLERNTPDPFYMEKGQRVSARGIVVRELVSNLLVHREYTSPLPAKVTVDAAGVRTENASRTLFEGRILLSDFNPVPKNPVIAGFFKTIGRAEALGSGTRNLFKYSRPFLGADPVLEDGDVFHAVIADAKGLIGGPRGGKAAQTARGRRADVDATIMHLVADGRRTTVREVAEAAGVTSRTASEHLRSLCDAGTLEAVGSTRDRGYFLRR